MEPATKAASGRRVRGLDADQRRAQRRQQLLDAALELIAANGYANTSIEQICQTAYVGTRGFYESFATKEACYLALLEQIAARVTDQMRTALDASPADASAVLLATFAHALVDDPRIARVAFTEAAGVSPAIEHQRRATRRAAAGFLQEVWRRYDIVDTTPAPDDLAGEAVAIGVIGGLFDLVAAWLHDVQVAEPPPDLDDLLARLRAFYAMILRGMTAHQRAASVAGHSIS